MTSTTNAAKTKGTMAMTMPKLTKLEQAILAHRLEVADSICDALQDDGWHEADIAAVIDELANDRFDSACQICEPIVKAVLKDCVEGSTYYGATLGNGSPAKERAVLAAGQSLARKIGDMIGERLVYPTY